MAVSVKYPQKAFPPGCAGRAIPGHSTRDIPVARRFCELPPDAANNWKTKFEGTPTGEQFDGDNRLLSIDQKYWRSEIRALG